MTNHPHKTSIRLISIVSFSIVAITLIISIFARGYKINFNPNNKSIITATGILSATSKPKGASVYLNDRLVTATDDNLNLKPNDYQLKIVKDGYLPWQKTIQIKKETVYQSNTQLFRSVPDLSPITYTGAINPIISPDNNKIVYAVASASAAADNGLFIIELNKNFPLNNRITPRQISPNLSNLNWSKFNFAFSPNSRQILATNPTTNISYLIPVDASFNSKNLYNIAPNLDTIHKDWQEQSQQLITVNLDKVPDELKPFVSTSSAQDIKFSDNQEKIFYLAQQDGDLVEEIVTPPPAQSTQKQSRDIKTNNYYVYDLKDDTNFFIGSQSDINQVKWLVNSESLIFTSQQQIKVMDYDNTNHHVLFAGDFQANTVLPTLDGNKIITLISPYQSASENLYTISIR
jgi:PEGA domain